MSEDVRRCVNCKRKTAYLDLCGGGYCRSCHKSLTFEDYISWKVGGGTTQARGPSQSAAMNDGKPTCALCHGSGESQGRGQTHPYPCLHERILGFEEQEEEDIVLLASLVQVVARHTTPQTCSLEDLRVLHRVQLRLEKVLQEHEPKGMS